MRWIWLIFTAALSFCPYVEAEAGSNPDAKIALHIKSHPTKAICQATLPPCNSGGSLVVQGNTLTPYDVMLLVVDADTADGVGGVSFGITYNDTSGSGVDIFGWTLCADAEYRGAPDGKTWPGSTSGNVIVWGCLTKLQKAACLWRFVKWSHSPNGRLLRLRVQRRYLIDYATFLRRSTGIEGC
jgi:hypothetical protein